VLWSYTSLLDGGELALDMARGAGFVKPSHGLPTRLLVSLWVCHEIVTQLWVRWGQNSFMIESYE